MIKKNTKFLKNISLAYAYSILFLIFALGSCKKQPSAYLAAPDAQASYKIVVRMAWTSPQFTIPAGAHFTSFIGMIHQKDSFLWAPNGFATGGLEDVAEIGDGVRLNNEIDAIIAKGRALQRFGIAAPAITSGFDTAFTFTLKHPCISFASMIAPSPDWFVGINQYSLIRDNAWINEAVVPLYLYDAGTEDGDMFGYNNPATMPQQRVRLLLPAEASVLANGNPVFAPIGTIRFTKR